MTDSESKKDLSEAKLDDAVEQQKTQTDVQWPFSAKGSATTEVSVVTEEPSLQQALDSERLEQEAEEVAAREKFLAITTEHDLQFTYIRSSNSKNTGGATIAWTWPEYRENGNVVEMAISWCHPKEQFCKKTGRFYSAIEYGEGRTIRLHLPLKKKEQRISKTLIEIFSACL